MMKRTFVLAAFITLGAMCTAHADTIQTFTLSGLGEYSGKTLSGSLTIDTTIGSVDALYVSQGGEITTTINSQGASDAYCSSDSCYTVYTDDFAMVFHNGVPNLIGYTGSDVNVLGNDVYLGHATLASSPEPSSLLLLGTGMLIVVGATQRRTMLNRCDSVWRIKRD